MESTVSITGQASWKEVRCGIVTKILAPKFVSTSKAEKKSNLRESQEEKSRSQNGDSTMIYDEGTILSGSTGDSYYLVAGHESRVEGNGRKISNYKMVRWRRSRRANAYGSQSSGAHETRLRVDERTHEADSVHEWVQENSGEVVDVEIPEQAQRRAEQID